MADEIATLVAKFKQLKNSGQTATLWLECQDGRSVITLQVHPGTNQPPEEPQHHPLRRGEAHYVRHRHVQSNRHTRRAAPSRVRRRERRAAERAAGDSAACLKIPPSPPHAHGTLKAAHAQSLPHYCVIFPPSVFNPNDPRAEEASIISSSPHQAVDQAAALRPTQGQGGAPLPVPSPRDISPSLNQVVDQAAVLDPTHGQGGVLRTRPVHVLGGQPCNVSPSPHQVVNQATKDQGGALCPGLSYVDNPHPALPPPHLPLLQPSEQGGQSPDVAAYQATRDLATPPLLPPIARGHPPQSQVQPFAAEQVVETLEVAAEEAAVACPVSPSLQVTPHPPPNEHFMGSFCFLASKDPSLLPLPSSLRVSRAHSPPPSKRILRSSLVRMKKEKISLNQMIDKGVKRFYISGVWVGHVCKFVHFVDGGAEPTLNCEDPGPLPPLGPLCSQQVTDLPPHPGPLLAAGEDPGPLPPIGSQKVSQLPPQPSPLPAGGLHVDLG